MLCPVTRTLDRTTGEVLSGEPVGESGYEEVLAAVGDAVGN